MEKKVEMHSSSSFFTFITIVTVDFIAIVNEIVRIFIILCDMSMWIMANWQRGQFSISIDFWRIRWYDRNDGDQTTREEERDGKRATAKNGAKALACRCRRLFTFHIVCTYTHSERERKICTTNAQKIRKSCQHTRTHTHWIQFDLRYHQYYDIHERKISRIKNAFYGIPYAITFNFDKHEGGTVRYHSERISR